MRIFAKFDDAGRRIATYTDDIFPEDAIPADAVEITEAQWRDLVDNPDIRRWNGTDVVAYDPPPPPVTLPDNPTLSDWRVALTLWGRIDDVTARVNTLVGSEDQAKAMLGKVAKERLEYANNVQRPQLLQLMDAFGFTAEDVDESLWRADRVRQGDLSGVWPLAA